MSPAQVLLGAVAAIPFVLVARAWPARARWIHALALVAATLVYVLWAARAGAGNWVSTEVGGLLVFSALALGGVRRYAMILAAGWLLHVGWDLGLHTAPALPWVPAWYVPACVGFDLVMAGAVAASAPLAGGGTPPDVGEA